MQGIFPFSITRARVLCALFLLALAAPGIGHLFSISSEATIAEFEYRDAAPLPKWPHSVAQWNEAPRLVDNYLKDRFGFRRQLIDTHQYIIRQLGIRPGDAKAVIGRDGWLFLADTDVVESYLGRKPFRSNEAAAWLNAAQNIQAQVARRGGEFTVLITPQKASIYGEFLPDYLNVAPTPSRASVLENAASTYGLSFLNAIPRLLSAKDSGQLFYKTDTHWNALGAYEGYLALMAQLRAQGIEPEILDTTRLQKSTTEGYSGDLARFFSNSDRYTEDAPGLSVDNPTSLTLNENLEGYDYDAFTGYIMEATALDRPSVLIVGDSFTGLLLPYLRESFSRVVFIHHEFGAFNRAILDEYTFDVVVLQMAERMLLEPLSQTEDGAKP